MPDLALDALYSSVGRMSVGGILVQAIADRTPGTVWPALPLSGIAPGAIRNYLA